MNEKLVVGLGFRVYRGTEEVAAGNISQIHEGSMLPVQRERIVKRRQDQFVPHQGEQQYCEREAGRLQHILKSLVSST